MSTSDFRDFSVGGCIRIFIILAASLLVPMLVVSTGIDPGPTEASVNITDTISPVGLL